MKIPRRKRRGVEGADTFGWANTDGYNNCHKEYSEAMLKRVSEILKTYDINFSYCVTQDMLEELKQEIEESMKDQLN